jgi:hypothetical protein
MNPPLLDISQIISQVSCVVVICPLDTGICFSGLNQSGSVVDLPPPSSNETDCVYVCVCVELCLHSPHTSSFRVVWLKQRDNFGTTKPF